MAGRMLGSHPMKTFATCFAVFLAAVLIAGAEESAAAKKDLAMMQGEWEMVSGSADGNQMPPDMRKQMKRVCKGNVTTTTMSGRIYLQATFTLDPSKNPKRIDYEMTEGATKGKKALGLYEVNGDTFKACFAAPGDERPQKLDGGDRVTYSVWKRVKK